jgi:hypothetical protein
MLHRCRWPNRRRSRSAEPAILRQGLERLPAVSVRRQVERLMHQADEAHEREDHGGRNAQRSGTEQDHEHRDDRTSRESQRRHDRGLYQVSERLEIDAQLIAGMNSQQI